MTDGSRRFTDREVALVLKRASEIDEITDARAAGHSGLSLDDLADIAAEVGISRAALAEAVTALDRGLGANPLEGAPLARHAVRAVPGEVDQAGAAELVRHVDASAQGAGSVTEALGSVRWSATDRFVATQVTVTPRDGQTTIEVTEKIPARLRRVVHFVPMAWGLVGALPLMEGSAGILPTVAIGGAALVVGAAVGRGAFSLLSRSSERRVRRLAAELAQLATAASGGSVRPDSAPDAPSDEELTP